MTNAFFGLVSGIYDVSDGKVACIKKQIARGQYKVNSSTVAEVLLFLR